MRRTIISLLAAAAIISSAAAPVDDARALYDEGRYDEALELLEPLHRKSPRDGNVNLLLGSIYMALGRYDEARTSFKAASDRGVAAAILALARLATDNYDVDEARAQFDAYDRQMRRARKSVPEEVEEERSRLVRMENMLERVERIEVIDSITVDADEFFKAYRLSPEAGRLADGATVRMPGVEMAFVPQNNSEIIYAEADSAGVLTLMGADILDDGTVDHPRPLPGEDLSGGGDAAWPFLMADGVTLYFANDGDESLGGYDIFMTRRNEDGYLQPQNIGMPYNSPYDDYLLAIDETTGAGWWATDRNHIPGKVTIYVFIPSATRVNIDPDDENLTALARMSDISLTHPEGADYSKILDAIDRVGQNADAGKDSASDAGSFVLPMGSADVIYHTLSDFKNRDARSAMAQAINARAEIASITARLDTLREAYRRGDRSGAVNILNLEQQLDEARSRMAECINRAVALETGIE